MKNKRDLFISYHTDSSKWIVEKIANILEEKGISCWYAPRDCESAWADVILEAIDKASMFLVIINEQSMNSEHVKNEINAAFSRYSKNQLAIVIFKVDTAKLNSSTEYYLGRIHMVNGVEPPFDDRIRELVNRIAYTKEHMEDKNLLSESPKFKSTIVTPALCFVGREKELLELDASLSKYRKVFVSGMGGVGKSELVREYITRNKESFRSIMNATYTTSLQDLIVNDDAVAISNFFRNPPDESDSSYLRRKIKFIEENGSYEDLLIIDNFNAKEDKHLDMLMNLPISIIFTSRNTYEDYCNLKLEVIKDEDELLEIFKKHYPKDISSEDLLLVKEIFRLVGNHTLTITIIANMMKKQRISPKMMMEKLEEQIQYDIETQKDVNNMIASIFEMSSLTDEEKYILQNLVLVPIFGISTERFFEYCKLDTYEVIDELISKNMILHDSSRDYISLHPVIARTVKKLLGYSDHICKNYLESVIELLRRAKYIQHQERDKVLEIIDQIMKVLPRNSEYYVRFYLACSKTYHAFAKHSMTMEKLEALNQDDVPLEARVEALTDIADAFRCTGRHEELLAKATEALEICKKLDSNSSKTKKLKSELFGRFGWYYNGIMNYPESIKYFDEQLSIVLDTEDETPERIGWAYFNVGVGKRCLKLYGEAIECFEKALSYFQSIKMDYAIADAYRAISGCHIENGDYDRAFEGLSKSLEMHEKLHGQEHNDTASTMHKMAMLYRKIGNMDMAGEMHDRSVEIIKKLGLDNMAQWWIEEFNS